MPATLHALPAPPPKRYGAGALSLAVVKIAVNGVAWLLAGAELARLAGW